MIKTAGPNARIVTLTTLCGCSQQREWYGIPPREIVVPLPPSSRNTNAMEQDAKPTPLRVRRFEMISHADPYYSFAEVSNSWTTTTQPRASKPTNSESR